MLLRNQLYAGIVDVTEYGVREKRGAFEPLISEDLFFRVQTGSFACLRVALRRFGAASFACRVLAWFTEPKLAEGERRMVDQTGIEPVTS